MKEFDYTKKCCFTGYRPNKFPFKLNSNDINFLLLQRHLSNALSALVEDGCRTFYSGMAMGFDIIAAEAVLQIKNSFNGIKLICAVPFENQQAKFPYLWQKRYQNIINYCDEKIILSNEFHKGCYHIRNCFMVDNSDFVVTWYDGRRGGTFNTLKYAKELNRSIINLNTDYCDTQLSINL